ncbi:MAG: hypothetical protein ABS81_00940 [Pseudonocardia sp. SCN 72-86]|nr:MAG: hypothetical protein ABS81_00940 [Pseudonocardia sp. SCN 72-86]
MRATRTRKVMACLGLALAVTVTGCTTTSGTGPAAANDPITVGVVTHLSGPLARYAKPMLDGLKAGVDYATNGSNEVNGRQIVLKVVDDAGDPAKAVAAATGLVGDGTNIIVGTIGSTVATPMVPFAKENNVLYIIASAAGDEFSGANRNTFRAGRQTYQDITAAAAGIGDLQDKKVTVAIQDTAYGRSQAAAVQKVFGAAGAKVDVATATADTTELAPFAAKIAAGRPDFVYVAWSGDTSAALWEAFAQQRVRSSSRVATFLTDRALWPSYGQDAADLTLVAHYDPTIADGPVAKELLARVPQADTFTNDGFVTAQMVVHALQTGDPNDTGSLISALEGWSFEGPKGASTIRADDHALLQPMYTVRMTGLPSDRKLEPLLTLDASKTTPPIVIGPGW